MKKYGFVIKENEKIIGVNKISVTIDSSADKTIDKVKKWMAYYVVKNEVTLGRIPKSYLSKIDSGSYDFETTLRYLEKKGYNGYLRPHNKNINSGKFYVCYCIKVG